MRRRSRIQMIQYAERECSLVVAMWSPGDGVTRYRFQAPGPGAGSYDADHGVYTALGLSEAWAFLRGFRAGFWAGLRAGRCATGKVGG